MKSDSRLLSSFILSLSENMLKLNLVDKFADISIKEKQLEHTHIYICKCFRISLDMFHPILGTCSVVECIFQKIHADVN